LLCTLGGTDKRDDSSKIGMFGMGYFAIFSSKLGTERVVVTTCCEGSGVEVSFHVETSRKCPKISLRLLDEPMPFSTRIEVQFNQSWSLSQCLEHAQAVLHYYPCRMTINGSLVESIREKARIKNAKVFKSGACHGFFMPDPGAAGSPYCANMND
jgi:hypothetical protein